MSLRTLPRLHFQFSFLSLQFSVLLALATPAFSQATFPTPVLTSIAPLGASAGETVTLTLRGSEVDEARSLLLNEHVIPIEPLKGKGWRVVLPADLKPGFYDLRLVSSLGVSNPRTFEISRHPTLASTGKNTAPEQALQVPLNSVIDGVFKAATPQWFRFHAKKGEVIRASFAAERFDVRSELMGTVLDAAGHEVARIKNATAAFTCAAEGACLLRLHDLMHRGGDDYGFRVTLEQLKAASEEKSGSPPPAAPRPLKAGDVVEDFFPEGGQPRVFDLPLKAGDKVVIEVRSHQAGNPSDPHLFIETLKPDGTGAPLAQVADAPAITPAPALPVLNRDPLYAYEAKVAGTLRLSLNDNFNTTSPFQLSVRAAPGSVPRLIALNATLPSAAARKGYEVGTANVCRGGILALEVIAPNRHAFSEAIELKTDGMQLPKGLACLGGFIGRGQSHGWLAFQAAADAPAGAAVVGTIPEAVYAQFAVADAARDQLLIRHAGPPAIGVSTLSAPALVVAEGGERFEAAADGKLEIALKITRHAEFQDALKLKVMGLTEIAKAPEADIAAKAGAGKLTLDMKALKLAPGEYGFILQGPAKMKYRCDADELTQAEAAQKKALAHHKEAQQKLNQAKASTTAQKQALVEEATRELQKAAAAKAAIDQRVKSLSAKAAPKEATFIVCSSPLRLTVKAPGK